MSGTQRTTAALYAELPDNTTGLVLPVDIRDIVASALITTPVSYAAAGTTQGTATQLNDPSCIITTVAAGSGVIATNGFTKIWNAGANPLLVYPRSGAQFEALGANVAFSLPVGMAAEVMMTSATQGYRRVLFPGSGINTLPTATNDTGAAAAGVPVGYPYLNGNFLMTRLT